MMGPALDELSVELESTLRIAKLNIDENPEVAARYGIKSVPTLLLFRNGEVVATRTGPVPKSQIRRWVEAELEK